MFATYSVAALSLLFSGSAFSQDTKVSLKPKFLVGKKYTLEQVMKQNTTIQLPPQAGGGEQEMKMTMNMVMAMTVTREGADEKKVTITFEDMVMDMDMGVQKMKMDAKDPAQKEMMGAILEMKPAMIYTNDDEFVRIEGIEAAGNPMLAKMMNADSMKQMVNGSLESMPGEAVPVGHTWEQDVAMPLEGVGEMSVKTRYKFERMETVDGHDCAVISFVGDMGGELDSGPAKIAFENTSISGTMYFDPEIGYVRKQEARTIMTMKMTIPGQPEMEMPLDQEQVLTLKALEDL